MYKKPNSLIIISFIAMMGLLALQAYWIVKIYKLTGANFAKEVNMAFEDGIKKELSLRCDTIQKNHRKSNFRHYSLCNNFQVQSKRRSICLHFKFQKQSKR